MPIWTLSDHERALAESMRFFGYTWDDVVYWLRCGGDERKVGEVYSLYVRSGARIQ